MIAACACGFILGVFVGFALRPRQHRYEKTPVLDSAWLAKDLRDKERGHGNP